MKRFFSSITVLVTITIACHSQGSGLGFSSMFDQIDSTRVPTGYLLDKAVEYIDLHSYDGVLRSSNYTDVSVFRNILLTINSSKVNSSAVLYDANHRTDSLLEQGVINLGITLFKYNYIVSNALTSNLLSFQGGKVYDVYYGGVWQNPYCESKVFAFTPSSPGITGTAVRFKLLSSNILSNLEISSLEFDAGDGGGYQTISIPYDNIAYYSTPGEKELRFRVLLGDNTTLESHSKIRVFDHPISQESVGERPDETHLEYLNSNPLITATVSYKSAHNGAIVKPFIYVEGFDNGALGLVDAINDIVNSMPDSLSSLREIYDLIENGTFDPITNRIGINSKGQFDFCWLYNNNLSSLIKNNFDVFYIDLRCPYASIIDNAALLVQILTEINNQKASNAEKNIIVGHSMGGLIVRYALRSMEMNNEAHQTDCYVSFDAPHLGVNFPVGLQFALRDLEYILYGEIHAPGVITYHLFDPVISYLMCIYTCPSVMQMMYYFVNRDGSVTDSYHLAWQNELNRMGFPMGDAGSSICNMAIANGGPYVYLDSTIMNLQLSVGNTGSDSISWRKLLLMLMARTDNLNLSILASRDNGSGDVVTESYAGYTKKWSWTNSSVEKTILDVEHEAPNNSQGFDYRNSSYLDNGFTGFDFSENGDIVSLEYYDPLLFVPQASALAINNYSTDYYINKPQPKTITPFDTYCIYPQSQHHTHIDTTVFASWILSQRALDLVGPDSIVLTGDAYSATGLESNFNDPDWSLSDSSVSVNNNGVVTVSNPGNLATICYRNHNGGAYLHKRRRVLAGFPDMTLTANYANSNYYTVSAVCTSTDNELRSKVDELAGNGDLRFIWGYKTGENSYSWQDTTSTRSFLATAQPGVVTRVAMLMSNTYNGVERVSAEPTIITIDRRPNVPFFYEPGIIHVGHNDYICNYSVLSGTSVSSNEYLGVWINPNYSPAPSAPTNVLIGSEPLPLETTCQVSIDGASTVVYCFDLFSSTTLQAALASPPSPPSNPSPFLPVYLPNLVPVKIRNGNTVLQEFYLSIYFD